MLDEVVDADDVRVFDPGEGEDLGLGHGHRLGVAGVQQALEDHPAVFDVAVDRQIDPAEAAVRDASLDFVLPTHSVATRKLGNKRISRAALGAEALGAPWLSVPAASDRLVAFVITAVPARLRYLRVLQNRGDRVALRNARNLDDPGAEAAATASHRRRTSAGRSHRRCARRRSGRGARRRRGRDGLRCGGCIGCGRGTADVAVAVDDGPAAARFGASHSVFPRLSTISSW